MGSIHLCTISIRDHPVVEYRKYTHTHTHREEHKAAAHALCTLMYTQAHTLKWLRIQTEKTLRSVCIYVHMMSCWDRKRDKMHVFVYV